MSKGRQFGRRAPTSGRAKSLVVFLHGYGADGDDLLGLADPLAPHLPNAVFVAPNAPERCSGNPFGYQWFPIPWLDGSSEAAAAAGIAASAAALNAFLDARLAEEGLTDAAMALVGFSQGTMMALEVAPRRAAPVACVVGFSGRLIAPERLAGEITAKPPILLIHGDRDEMVPPSSMPEAAAVLTRVGIETYTHVSPGTAHGIAPDGLGAALGFLQDRLPR